MSNTPRTDMAWKTLPSVYDFIVEMKRMERELNANKDRIKRLEEAGDAMAMYASGDEARQWDKAKEAKP